VELHEGTLSVSSEGRGRGATFAIRLPVEGAAPVAPEDAAGG
jgi:signal transduction histidine kinase